MEINEHGVASVVARPLKLSIYHIISCFEKAWKLKSLVWRVGGARNKIIKSSEKSNDKY